MKEAKYLAKNIGLLTLSQFGTKLLSFFLVPLYTNVLSTEEYGTYDFFNTTVLLLIPLLTLNICDATLRFSLDKESDSRDVFSISIKFFVISVLAIVFLSFINKLMNLFPIFNQYLYCFILMYFSSAITGILNNYARGIDKVRTVAVSGVLGSATMLVLNVLFLLPLHMGLKGYFAANIIGLLVQFLYITFSIKAWKLFKWVGMKNKMLTSNMLSFSVPLIINNISWWVNNASNRYVIIWLCGMSANGIFSVSYKIPSILMIFQGIFSQAWTLSAVKDFDPEDKNGFFSKMYNSYNVCMTIICSLIIIFSKYIARLLYAQEFYTAWKYSPLLLIAVVFGALSGYIGGIYSAVKDSKAFAKSTLYSAIINIILNIVLVKTIGIMGAAMALVVAYAFVWAFRVITVKKYIRLELNLGRDVLCYFVLLLQTILLLSVETNVVYLYESILFFILVLLFKNSLCEIKDKLFSFAKKKRE
ncbi:Membrane protein involved in the export of O-antigen and teichoic acid [Fibrobacter sp. UWB15]|uniref:lipopolysaccharide biosynthesis protein n=1 Tax=unclassified Fibrobacter TaxID=2634177 RepID=UPI00091E2BF1|nr:MULTISPECIES: oligosaccharide flippase family protein [unclassified Fibrobacter]PWJ65603.1 O-antigen/teichoic acid export membrane protein [Fibrobacter sp. UWB6]SHF98077.1 Membrane protein involved in the export of O-antigen and teichoic acid [Fibrobacter sp. UWB8]SMG23716.1 Membrane protein involved in the export of O-antigen and teichoic acid [Fibrobacter sp. UWB15]